MLVRLVRAGARALVSWVLRCALWLARRAVHFDSVELGPWSGTVRVRGARVREDVLRRVGLGLVLRGSLGTLTLRIPWRRLRSRPVVLELDRLELHVVDELRDHVDGENGVLEIGLDEARRGPKTVQNIRT